MKKIIMMAAAVAMTAISFTACNKGEGTSNISDTVDSLTYDLGVAQADGLKQYMTMQLGVDTAYIDEFIKGLKEGAVKEASPKKEAYMQGLNVGKQVQGMAKGLSHEVYNGDSTKSVNINKLINGLVDGLKGKATMTSEEAFAQFQEKLQPIKDANIEAEFGEYKKENIKYLEENKKKEGVVTLPSGVQYKVLVKGDGPVPADTSTVKVLYVGKLIDGTEFDSTKNRGDKPFEVNLARPQVIPGWVEVLKLMPAGSKWEVTIPQEQGYGTQSAGQIKPFSTLIFTIETLK